MELKDGEFTMGKPRSGEALPQELRDKGWDMYNPKPKRFTRQIIEEAARKSITTRHYTLWGRAFDVYQKNSLDEATKWLTDEIVRVLKELKLPVIDDNFIQGVAEGQVIKHGTQVTAADYGEKRNPYGKMTGIEIEDLCDEDD